MLQEKLDDVHGFYSLSHFLFKIRVLSHFKRPSFFQTNNKDITHHKMVNQSNFFIEQRIYCLP